MRARSLVCREPATLRPLLDPDHAVAVSGGSCGQCVAVAIAAWSGCPRRATFDRALAIAAGALLGLGLLVCALPPLRQRAAHLARTLRPAAPLGRSLAMSPAPLAGEKRVVQLQDLDVRSPRTRRYVEGLLAADPHELPPPPTLRAAGGAAAG